MILAPFSRQISTVRFTLPSSSSSSDAASHRTRFLTFTYTSTSRHLSHFQPTSALPFAADTAKHYSELEAAIAAVETASHLCVEVQTALQKCGVREKDDQTPVTVADFSVQALISLELGRRFPGIPLVAEEDSASVRGNNLVEPVVSVVVEKARAAGGEALTEEDVLEAIDRGGPEAFTFGAQPATYWLLDPIDGTIGFVQGNKALFVVGLALVVDGKIVLGVMGCLRWQESSKCISGVEEEESTSSETGLLMISHVGCGTWTRSLSSELNGTPKIPYSWTRCFVDGCSVVLCKYLLVASGKGSLFIQRQKEKVIKASDHAVGIICVLEAGGRATDWEGNQVDLAADETGRRSIYPEVVSL